MATTAHGERLRSRQLIRRVPQQIHDLAWVLTTHAFWRSAAVVAAAYFCWRGLWAPAFVAMLASILAQLMIMERHL